MEFVGQVDHALASIVEFQPHLVVTEPARVDHVPGCILVPSQHPPPFAKLTTRAAASAPREQPRCATWLHRHGKHSREKIGARRLPCVCRRAPPRKRLRAVAGSFGPAVPGASTPTSRPVWVRAGPSTRCRRGMLLMAIARSRLHRFTESLRAPRR